MKHWALPRRKTVWLLFDMSNGDERSKRYVWWFDTKKAALEYREWQLSQRYCANLSQPIKFRRDDGKTD